jgi:ABC-2 type transport system ATP-binding protein
VNNVIEVREIGVRIGGVQLFVDASLEIESGQTHALTGPNGSGTSVLLRTICGFITPDTGRVWIDPIYLSRGRSFPDRFGIAIDGPAYLPGLTGLDNLRELARIRKKIGLREIRATMIRVGLDPDNRQKVRNYSLGMKQKLSLSQALMEQPEVLLLDEPFNALDVDSVTRIKSLLRDEQAAGRTLVFTSHNDNDIVDLCDRIFRIHDQRIEQVESSESA